MQKKLRRSVEKNGLAYAELCGCLDDKMLMLILYEAPDDGKKSLEILRRHFESEEKTRIELADDLLRVEKIVAALNRAKETLSDSLLEAIVLNDSDD